MTAPCSTVTGVRVLNGYRLELTFSDGVQGIVDLSNRIIGRGGAFELLENLHYFRQVRVDSELGTIVWPNGVDFCPELLRGWAMSEAVPQPEAESLVS